MEVVGIEVIHEVAERLPETDDRFDESTPLELEGNDVIGVDVTGVDCVCVVCVDTGLVESVWVEAGTVDELFPSSRYARVAVEPSAINTTKL